VITSPPLSDEAATRRCFFTCTSLQACSALFVLPLSLSLGKTIAFAGLPRGFRGCDCACDCDCFLVCRTVSGACAAAGCSDGGSDTPFWHCKQEQGHGGGSSAGKSILYSAATLAIFSLIVSSASMPKRESSWASGPTGGGGHNIFQLLLICKSRTRSK